MERIAVFPGTFDPITIGHADLISRAVKLFDKVIVAIGVNSKKQNMLSPEMRVKLVETVFSGNSRVYVKKYEGLTVNFCREAGARYIIRGLRAGADFDYEKTIAQLNQNMDNDIETVCLISRPEFSHISSTIVREIIAHGGDYRQFVPAGVTI